MIFCNVFVPLWFCDNTFTTLSGLRRWMLVGGRDAVSGDRGQVENLRVIRLTASQQVRMSRFFFGGDRFLNPEINQLQATGIDRHFIANKTDPINTTNIGCC